jgi:hypothetical protein
LFHEGHNNDIKPKDLNSNNSENKYSLPLKQLQQAIIRIKATVNKCAIIPITKLILQTKTTLPINTPLSIGINTPNIGINTPNIGINTPNRNIPNVNYQTSKNEIEYDESKISDNVVNIKETNHAEKFKTEKFNSLSIAFTSLLEESR